VLGGCLEARLVEYFLEARPLFGGAHKKRNEPHSGCTEGPFLSDKHLGCLSSGAFIVVADLGSSVLESIELHRRRVSAGWRYRECCNRCESSSGFTKHEARRRQVRVLVGLTVQIVKIAILRWRCVACRCVFTDWPDFPASLPAVRDALPARLGG
jgi:hypothetical protein